jgi:hypothetical protein
MNRTWYIQVYKKLDERKNNASLFAINVKNKKQIKMRNLQKAKIKNNKQKHNTPVQILLSSLRVGWQQE